MWHWKFDLLVWFVDSVLMLSYVPVSQFVPQGLESFRFPHFIFPSCLRETAYVVWWPLEYETKLKGWFTQFTFYHFIWTTFCWRNWPQELLTVSYTEYPEHRGHCFWNYNLLLSFWNHNFHCFWVALTNIYLHYIVSAEVFKWWFYASNKSKT